MDADALRTELAWIHRIAQALLRDREDAQDAAQDAALSAMRHPPRRDGDRRPWLFRVTQNAARSRVRSRRRREAREATVDGPSSPRGPSESAERLDLFQRLTDELLALPEPLRRTLVARYYDDRSVAELAAEDGVAEATVRWRTHEGLRRLRRRLDDARPGWAVLLVPTVTSPIPHAIWMAGGLVMLSISLVLWAVVTAGPDPAVAVAPTAASIPRADPAADPSPSPARTVAAADPAPLEPPRATLTAQERDPVAENPEGLALRVVDEDGAPLSQVEVWATRSNDFGIEEPSTPGVRNGDGQFDVAVPVVPDVAGRVILPFAEAYESRGRGVPRVVVTAPGRSRRVLTYLRTGELLDLGTVTLWPAGAVTGTVRAEGSAAGSLVGLQVADREPLAPTFEFPAGVSRVWETAADGAFQLDHVDPGMYRLLVRAPGRLVADNGLVEITAGATVGPLDVYPAAAPSNTAIRGRVVGEDQRPRCGWFVLLLADNDPTSPQSESFTQTGEDGRFELTALQDGPYAVTAWLGNERDFARYVSPGDELTLTVRAPRRWPIEVNPVDALSNGALVQAVSAVDGVRVGHGGPPDRAQDGWGCDLPGQPFRVEVRAPGYGRALSEVVDPTALNGPIPVALTPLGVVKGRVMHGGVGVAQARLWASRGYEDAGAVGDPFAAPVAERLRSAPLNGPGSLGDPICADEDGRFAFTVDHQGPLAVTVLADGLAPAVVHLPVFDGMDGAAFDVELSAGGTVEGRVVVPHGANVDGIVIGLARSDGIVSSARTRADGSFRFEHLASGRHLLRECPSDLPVELRAWTGPSVDMPATAVIVEEGQVSRVELSVSGALSCTLSGRLLVDGAPAVRFNARLLTGPDRAVADAVPVAADGTFLVTTRKPGPARLVLSGMGDDAPITVVDDLTIQLGQTDWSLDLATGTLGVKGPTEGLSAITPLGGSRFAITAIVDRSVRAPAGDGVVTRDTVPAAIATSASPEAGWKFSLPAGGRQTVRVR